MDARTRKVLEYDVILDMLAAECVSPLGVEQVRSLVPYSYRIEVERAQKETQEAYDLILHTGSSPLYAFDDIRDEMNKARVDSMLGCAELLRIRRFLSTSRQLRSALLAETEPMSLLYEFAQNLCSLHLLEDEIDRCILSDDEVSDHASPELASIRRAMRLCHQRIRDKLNAMIRSSAYANVLQDPIITIRNDRFVVPVRAEYRSSVPGMVHDQSGSGATLFIEPMAVVEINNELKEYQLKEKAEIERILTELTRRVAAFFAQIQTSVESMASLDFIFAKGRLSHLMEGVAPKIHDAHGPLKIRKGRHPLIDPKVVVPITMWLGEDFSTLIITGPNTGGKTVTLKTCGLFAAMAQSGLHIPASDGCEMPLFDEIYADIGDEQSISQSLSTFSSHMTHIVEILEKSTKNSLVLLDELGAGTDPTEGAALAIAILERLFERGIYTLATTHYSELKAFALATPGIENGSVEFDVASLRPTYRLSIGIPGKSNAFEISRKLGLSEELITKAQEKLDQNSIRFEDVIENAEYHRQLAEKEKELAMRARQEMEETRARADREAKRLEEQRTKILEEARAEAARIVKRTKQEAQDITAQLRRLRDVAGQSDRDRALQQNRDKLRELEKETIPEAARTAQDAAAGEAPKTVSPGDYVYLVNVAQEGTVLSEPNDKKEVQVQVGPMKMMVKLANLRLMKRPKKTAPETRRAPKLRLAAVPMELDIRGSDTQEGVAEMELYLDQAVMGGLKEVSVIHGKGTGLLRDAVHQALRRNSHVDSFRLGRYGEGETGVTIIRLK